MFGVIAHNGQLLNKGQRPLLRFICLALQVNRLQEAEIFLSKIVGFIFSQIETACTLQGECEGVL